MGARSFIGAELLCYRGAAVGRRHLLAAVCTARDGAGHPLGPRAMVGGWEGLTVVEGRRARLGRLLLGFRG